MDFVFITASCKGFVVHNFAECDLNGVRVFLPGKLNNIWTWASYVDQRARQRRSLRHPA
jgi:hypothetical protein